MATAGWRSSSVFAVFYNKPLSTGKSFVNSVLRKDWWFMAITPPWLISYMSLFLFFEGLYSSKVSYDL